MDVHRTGIADEEPWRNRRLFVCPNDAEKDRSAHEGDE